MRIRIQKGENQPKKEEKLSPTTRKKMKINFFYAVFFLGKEFGLKMFTGNVRK
jgi:hypothetical protein